MRRRIVATTLAIALAGLVSACEGTAVDATVELVEFSIAGPRTLTADTDALEIENAGQYSHTLVITDADGEVAAATGLIPAGETTHLDLDLEPGQYVFTCRIIAQTEEGELVDHFEAGMHASVAVGS